MSEGKSKWPRKTIESCCEILNARRIPLNAKERAERKGIYPYYGANGIQSYIDDYLFEGNAVLLAEDGGHFKQYASRPLAQWVTGRFWVNNHAHILRAKRGTLDKWVFYALVHKDMGQFFNSNTRIKLKQSDLRKISIPHPPLRVQCKIIEILTAVDEAIEAIRARFDKLRELKKGILEMLLNRGIQHTRQKRGGSPKNWVRCALYELGVLNASSVDKRIKVGEAQVGLLNYMDVYKNRFLSREIDFQIVSANERERKVFSIKKGDIFFTPSSETPNEIGRTAVAIEDLDDVLQSYHLVRMKLHDPDAMELYFRGYAFQGRRVLNQFRLLANGSTRFTLSMQHLAKVSIHFPKDRAEQKEIASILLSIDLTIESIKKQIERSTLLKRALIRNLITGKIRVRR